MGPTGNDSQAYQVRRLRNAKAKAKRVQDRLGSGELLNLSSGLMV